MTFQIVGNKFGADIEPVEITATEPNIGPISGTSVVFLSEAGRISAGCNAMNGAEICVVLEDTKIRAIECVSSDGAGGCTSSLKNTCPNRVATDFPKRRR